MDTTDEPIPATPKLWNPNAATLWSIIFTPVFGALIQAKNWKELDQAKEAKKSLMWVYLTVAVWCVIFFLPDSVGSMPAWIWLIVWYFANGKKQVDYVKKNAISYEKKAWQKPLALGCVGLVVFVLVVFVIGYLIAPEPASTAEQDSPASTALGLDATRKAAESGDARSQFNLGVMYDNGEGVPEDNAEAVTWYRKAAEQGYAQAQENLGLMYLMGEGVPEDKAEALKWYRKAANQGDVSAQYILGIMYDNGEGVPEDDAEAATWFRKAAEQEYADAQFRLGIMYDIGEGVPENDAEAVTWYRKAAEQGVAPAQHNLGSMYYNGEGVPKDDAEAVTWYRKAAEQGFADAQFQLGIMYANGEGVPQNDVEAYAWVSIAAANGQADAKEALPEVKAKLTPDQIAEAQKRATQLFEQINANKQ